MAREKNGSRKIAQTAQGSEAGLEIVTVLPEQYHSSARSARVSRASAFAAS